MHTSLQASAAGDGHGAATNAHPPTSITLAFDDIDREQTVAGLAIALRIALADGLENFHAGGDLAKDAVLTIQMGRGTIGDEELRTIGIWSSIRHRKDTGLVVFQRERAPLVVELVAGSAHTGAGGIATLGHKA